MDPTDLRENRHSGPVRRHDSRNRDTLVKAGVIADARAFVFEAIERGATSNFIAGRHVVTRP